MHRSKLSIDRAKKRDNLSRGMQASTYMNLGPPDPKWHMNDFDAMVESKARAMKARLPIPEPPPSSENLKFPGTELPVLSMDEIGRLMGAFASLANYADFLRAVADIDKEMWEAKYIHALEARKLAFAKEKVGEEKVTKHLLEAKASQEKDIIYRYKKYWKAYIDWKTFESLFRGYERSYEIISREISRRQTKVERGLK